MMTYSQRNFLFLNIGHLLDHYFMLIFTTAVLAMSAELGSDLYGERLLLVTWSFFFFGGASIPAGWLGDKWSRHGMMVVFFIGIGLASIMTGLMTGTLGIQIGLAVIGIFAAIYHPIGIALVAQEAERVGRALAINGVWGNVGVAVAAITTAAIVEYFGWRAAFIVPGVASIVIGIGYALHLGQMHKQEVTAKAKKAVPDVPVSLQRRVFIFLLLAPLFGGLIFQGTTITLPAIMEERLAGLFDNLTEIGGIAAAVFLVAAVGQIIVGELLDRFPIRRIYLTVITIQAALCAMAIYSFGWMSLVFTAPLMLATFGAIPMNDWIVAHYIGAQWRSRVYAVKSLMSLGVGAIAVQLFGRVHVETGSFDMLFLIMTVCAVIVLLSAILLLPGRSARNQPEIAPAE